MDVRPLDPFKRIFIVKSSKSRQYYNGDGIFDFLVMYVLILMKLVFQNLL